jgi:murein DD-endopeptidase MepM/ murein hydrolase activator NlpD
MLELLKTIYQKRSKSLTVMVVDAHHPDETHSFHYSGTYLTRWISRLIWVLILVGGFLVLVMVRQVINGGDIRVQSELDQLQRRVQSLSDSVDARDQQLRSLSTSLEKIDSLNTEIQILDGDANQASIVTNVTSSNVSPFTAGQSIAFDLNERVFQQNTPIIDLVFPTFPTRFPVKGQITRTYRPDLEHYGIDFAVDEGTLAFSIGSGQVISTQWTLQYGYVVTITHYDGYILVYKHLLDTYLTIGDLVYRGQVIGRVGKVGTLSTGPHLHLEIWKNGSSLDPLPYFNKN